MQSFEQQRHEAEERVKEMNRIYRQKSGIAENKNLTQNENPNKKPTDESSKSLHRPVDLLKLLRLDGLKNDPDRLLLLGIFLLLNSEGTDELLLYALLYIMM